MYRQQVIDEKVFKVQVIYTSTLSLNASRFTDASAFYEDTYKEFSKIFEF